MEIHLVPNIQCKRSTSHLDLLSSLFLLIRIPDIDPAVFTRPKTEPECFGAMSSVLARLPNLWKLHANMAVIVSARAAGRDLANPGRQAENEVG